MLTQAAVVRREGAPFTIEEIELAEPREGEMRVRIVACGVCHTDEKVRIGYFTPLPAVLGHEGAGIVEKLGPGVEGFSEGDHVVLSYPACGTCDNCRRGKPFYCYSSTRLSFGGRFQDGHTPLSKDGEPINCFFGQSSFATHAVVPVFNAVRVDPDIDLRLLAPLGCGIQTGAGAIVNALRPGAGDSVAIFGTGTVGLSAIMAASIAGCGKIIAVDILESRLQIAREYGATEVINSAAESDVPACVRELTGGNGADFALDTTGVEICTLNALKSMHTGARGACVAASRRITL
ncbi:MAG: NAD(P)-dependent alcohol dehydrogenase, partial [Clostridiales bacterium]|nr:NAD(P)-dependent alcohol dehydrogenase [Clostridiales bacterium]